MYFIHQAAVALTPLLLSVLVSTTCAALIPTRIDVELAGTSLVVRDVPKSAHFKLNEPSYDLFRHKKLRDGTVQQSFAFDQRNRRLFVAQLKSGSPKEKGDLCITELDFSGNYVGHMYVLGSGHGVAIGAESVGSSTYLWTEANCKANGYGERLARFKWASGNTIDVGSGSDSATKFKPFADSANTICNINGLDQTLVCRFSCPQGKCLAGFAIEKANKGDFSAPLYNVPQPKLTGRSDVFQGYVAYGSYIYMLTGTSNDVNGGNLDSEITSVDVNTGKIHQGPIFTQAGKSLDFREPEGMGIYTTVAGEPRLFLGFASGNEAGNRRCNLFYKNVLINPE
ncbi:unnamed protein product [Clonostachys rhizophaga]|uniref:P68 RBP/TagC-like beta-propeller domain-containing protein n=1 Tax=Clonostachys rhizophaga TaxID=160324 RepID=A0A9N9VFH1_9HYPO|nr:unnamed protein product [Clonostachys rhizophaga]